MQQLNRFQAYIPVDTMTASNFECVPDTLKFHLFFGKDWRSHPWNRKVLERMARVAQERLKEKKNPNFSHLSTQHLVACLWTAFQQAFDSWKRRQVRVHTSGNRLETPAEAVSRSVLQEQKSGLGCRYNNRRHAVSLMGCTFNFWLTRWRTEI